MYVYSILYKFNTSIYIFKKKSKYLPISEESNIRVDTFFVTCFCIENYKKCERQHVQHTRFLWKVKVCDENNIESQIMPSAN